MPYSDTEKSLACRRAYRWRRYAENRAWLDALKSVPCADCQGTFPPECMDFDHRDPSEKSFGIAVNIRKERKLLEAEIAKCEIICANCHRIRTKRKVVRHG